MIEEAVEAIRSGEVIGMPTDTVYGLAAHPLDERAIWTLYELKGRPVNKPVGLLAADPAQAGEIGVIEGQAARLAEEHWPGALTLIVTPRVVLADWVGDSQRRTVGIRVPDHDVARDLLRVTGPLAVTSANRSGGQEALSDAEAREVFGDEIGVYLRGTCPGGQASTVIDATTEDLRVLRPGPVVIG